ncbi:L-asparaginase 1 [Pseudomonas fluorescens]|uniref:asparaginase n=1 Tax=Pseudomonas lactucae TaxID=2813360 RepID=A0A9X0YE54_9PSED|nr:asparaginase [Pseudomonas lactucae]OPA82225.1 L-asparaginase 1 [Pseudomonas fluorescens]MBN2978223.1 asparaginase [Pseudomonas lactucae]MBN2986504.1 asparaginase [Pseudomonas lactucae]OPB03416.1 L-asparaginase 1 [Pseudomonas fluorescens]OPB14166.1 L-asparaginase 1 [Pseudomonas fluorescens]
MSSSSNVMVLYTGGTIGMQASANGLAPASGFETRMREQLANQPVPAWRFREMAPLIDSANMTPAYWQRLRSAVIEAVDQGCDAVLILHGTDTLAYSAAAMSFQLLGLPVPVVFTGSMLPAGVPDSDAWENVSGALHALGGGLAPGVHLHFHGALLAPTACAKIRSFGRNPFAALNRQGGVARVESIPPALDYRQPKTLANIGVLPLVPGIAAAQLDALLGSGIQALILECFGSGTGPSDNPEFLASLKRAQDNAIVVVAITQCHEGGVELDVYEAGSRLRGVGVLSGGGMTREAAFGKLNALLGAGLDNAEVRRLVETNLCGELG